MPTSTAAISILEKEFKMTSSFSKTAGRSLALATLVGASLTLTYFSQASARPPAARRMAPSRRPPPLPTSNKPETVEQRITTLKTALKITPDQESEWDGVAKAMRENAASMDKLVQGGQGAGEPQRRRRPQDLPGVQPGQSRWPEEPERGLQDAV